MSWGAIDELETDAHQLELEPHMPAVRCARLRKLILEKMLPYMRAEHQKLLDERECSRRLRTQLDARHAEIRRICAARKGMGL